MRSPGRVNPMSVRSKSALAQALLSELMKKELCDISISDITERAGLSRQTFYTNFSKKEDILIFLLNGLFAKYSKQLPAMISTPKNFIIDYLIFWDGNKEFISLLFGRGLGYLFQDRNRTFFMEESSRLNSICSAEPWQLPYIKASLAGLTYELLHLWISKDQGLSVNVLTSLAGNLLSGKIFV